MEDLIRRSDAIKGAKRLHNLFQSPFYNRDRVEMIEAYFNDIPSADRPQGEWFVFDGESDLYVDIKCSYCRKVYTVDSYKRDDIGFTIEDLKFCPNCGARMKGADDETD